VADELIKLAWSERRARVGVDRQMVSKWERDAKLPDRMYRELLCTLYGTTADRLGFRSVMPSTAITAELDSNNRTLQLESPLDIAERMQALVATKVSDDAIGQLDKIIELVIDDYERSGPAALATRVVAQRRKVEQLLVDTRQPRHRDRLLRTASRLSALLGYMAVNLGKFSIADAYSKEAFTIAEFVEDDDLRAWVRGTESFCAYYRRDFVAAVDLARDGLHYAHNGPQAVRLAINGEARALGKLRDTAGVLRAVEQAYRLSDQFDPPPGVSPCISFGVYSPARTAANAVTAFVSLGQPEQVAEYSELVTPAMDISESSWTQSLVRLDTATAMVLARNPEPEQAAQLVTEALTISADRPITSVLTRSREFLDITHRWQELPAMTQAAETLKAASKR